MSRFCIYVLVLFLCACKADTTESSREVLLEEIRSTELAFSQLAEEAGIRTAFLTYAAEDAVLLRSGRLIQGKDGIAQHFGDGPRDTTVHLTWSPDFVDVSSSGDLGYTYGEYVYAYRDSLNQPVESTGYFHTVWKRQENGEWKFVWD